MRFLLFERTTTGDVQFDQWEWGIGETTLHFGDESVLVRDVRVVREQRAKWMHSMFRRFVSLQPEPVLDRVSGTFADTATFTARMACASRILTAIGDVPADGFVRWVKGNEFELVARIDAVIGDDVLPFPPHVVPSATPDAR